MPNYYELFIASESVSEDSLNQLNSTMAKHVGVFKSYQFIIKFEDGVIRYFIVSEKDISHISEGFSIGVIKAVSGSELNLDQSLPRKAFLRMRQAANIYQLKEELKTKNNLQLNMAELKISILPMLSYKTKLTFRFNNQQYSTSVMGFPANFIAINFSLNKKYFKKSYPSYLNIEKALHLLKQDSWGGLFRVDGFPYFNDDRYLNLTSYNFNKHSLILGSSGSGKSKFIELLISKISELPSRNNYKILVIDPHASLEQDLSLIEGSKIVNFKDSSTDLFPDSNSDVAAAVELTSTLFKSLLSHNYNSKLEVVLKFSLLVLLTAQAMSLPNLKQFVVDLDFRNKVLDHVSDYIPINVKKFFGADFNELRTKFYNDTIAPIAALVDEMQMQPAISGGSDYPLVKHIQENFLTVFSLNKVSMGEKVVKTVSGLLIQQIFLIAQSRIMNENIILFIDEVSVVQNPALASILSEARKFNLSVVLTQQYFGQIEKDLQDSILTNVSNYYIFRVSEEDARRLEGNIKISIPSSLLEAAKLKGQKETDLRIKALTELNPRECIFRVESGGQYMPSIKGKTLNVESHQKKPNTKLNFIAGNDLPKKFVDSETDAQATPITSSPPLPPSHASTEARQRPSDALVQSPWAYSVNVKDLLASQSKEATINKPNINNKEDR